MSEVFGAALTLKDNVSSVLKQARESSKGFRGEVEKARSDLQRLDKQKVKDKDIRLKNTTAYKAIDGVQKKLEPLSKKAVQLIAKTEKATAGIKKFAGVLGSVKDKTISVAVQGAAAAGKALGKAAMIGTAAAFTAVAAAGTSAVVSAVQFESQMQNVGTLLDGNVSAKLQEMGSDLKKVSMDTGVATADLTDGLYQVVSAFGESADSVRQLEIAAKAAKAGNATTTDSVNLLSAVTKGYGDTSAAAMQKASDLAFATVKLGQTSFPELASSMGQVVPLASTLKVSQEELFGAMSTLTGVTGGTAEVTTQLKATMQSFLSPGSEMAKALKKMGYESGAAALESEGLGDILNGLKESVNGDEVAFANLFSSVEAKNAVLALTGAQADDFATKTAAMADAAGIADEAFDTQTSSVAAMADKIKNAGSVMMTSLGEKALPYITKALDKVIDHLPAMEEAFDRVSSAVGPIVDTLLKKGGELWSEWQPVLSQIGSQFQTALSQALPFFTGMLTNFGQIVPYVQPVVTTFSGIIASILPVIGPIFEGISSVVADVFPVVAQIVQDAGGKIQRIFQIVADKTGFLQEIFAVAGPAISSVLSTAWSVISPILDVAITGIDIFASAIEWAFPYVQGIIQDVWSVLQPIIEGIGAGISLVADAVQSVGEFFTGSGTVPGNNSGPTGNNVASTGNNPVPVGNNATGTSFWQGGYTMVGEHGPELMTVPTGSKIYSAGQTQSMLAGSETGSIKIQIAQMSVREESDIDKIAEALVKKIKEARDNM